MCLRDVMLVTEVEGGDYQLLTITSPSVLERVSQAELEFSAYQRRDGSLSRPTVAMNAKTMEPAAWWSMYCRHLPILSSIAARVLAQPAAASQAERNWSVYGQIKTANKSRMQHATADKLVYCHETMHLQDSLQSASWVADLPRWESDSDSGTDEEDGDADFSEETILLLMS